MLDPSDGDTWALEPGQMVQGYEIVASIGSGGYGQVYKAIAPDGVTCALKWMRLARNKDRNALQRALLEIGLLQKVDHINVVRYRGSGMTDDGNVWIAMELLEGVSFRELISKGTLGVERVLRLGRQVCDGLSRLHALDAVHRDIKPENLFLLAADVVKIIDFGIAKCAGVRLCTTRGQTLGTALYMAPDQLSYKGEQGDPRWDVYALGIVLYEMFRKRHPFDDNGELPTAAVICGMQLNTDIPPLHSVIPGFPKGVSDVIAKALEKDPKKRYASAKEFGAALSAERKVWLDQHQEDALAAPIQRSEVLREQLLALSAKPTKESGPSSAPMTARPPPRQIVTERIATPIVPVEPPASTRPPRQIVTDRIATPIVQVERPTPTRPPKQIVTERIATPDTSVPGGQVVTDRIPSDADPQLRSSWPAWLAPSRMASRPTLPGDGEGLIHTPSSLARRGPTMDTIRVATHPVPPPGRMRRTLPIAMVIVGGLLIVVIGFAIPLDLDVRAARRDGDAGIGPARLNPAEAREDTSDGGTSMVDGGSSTEDGGSSMVDGGALAASPALPEDPPAEPSGSAASSPAPPGSRPGGSGGVGASRGTAPPPWGTPPRGTPPQGTARLPVPSEPEIFQRPLRPRTPAELVVPDDDEFILRRKPSPTGTAPPRKPAPLNN